MATATKTKKRAKRTAKKSSGPEMAFRGKAAEKNEATINAWLTKRIQQTIKNNPQFVGPAARDLGIELTSDVYTRDMLMEWSKAQLLKLLQESGIEPPIVRDRQVENLVDTALNNRDKLIIPAALKA